MTFTGEEYISVGYHRPHVWLDLHVGGSVWIDPGGTDMGTCTSGWNYELKTLLRTRQGAGDAAISYCFSAVITGPYNFF